MTGLDAAPRLSILLLADAHRKQAQNLLDHVQAFGRYSTHSVTVYNPRGARSHDQLDLRAFDVVVVHWSLVVISDEFLSPDLREKIRRFEGLKIQFLQDEYRWVDEITEMLRFLEVDALFTVTPPEAAQQLYASRLPGVEIVPTYAGFVPESLVDRPVPPTERRPIDVGYRGRWNPPWLGRLGHEKLEIGRGFLERARSTSLHCDIAWSEHDRVYGERWVQFLSSCKATLATESGASIADFDGSVERGVRKYLERHPGAPFAELHREVLAPYEGNVVINVISPRVLEAAALRSALVLFPGSYSDAVRPWQNYVPLEKDFSNFDEVVAAIQDVRTLRELADRTYEELVASNAFSLRAFVRQFDEFVATRGASVATSSPSGSSRPRASHALATRTLLGVEAASFRRALAKGGLLVRLLARDDDLRSLVVGVARDRRLREKFGVHRLFSDVIRLGVVRRAHAGRPITRQRFAVVARLDDSGTLTFVTHPRKAWQSEAVIAPEEVERALMAGEVATVAWNNLAEGSVFSYRNLRGVDFDVVVGYLGIVGIYQFGTLTELARQQPERAWRALALLAEPPRQPLGPRWFLMLPRPVRRKVRDVRRTFRDRPWWVEALASPRPYAATAGIVLFGALRHTSIRRVAWAVLSDERRRAEVGDGLLARDVLLLHLLRQARRRRLGTVACVDQRSRGAVLLFSSRGEYAPVQDDVDLAGIDHVIWSHRELGPNVFYPVFGARHLQFALGRRGIHEFPTLRVLLRDRRDLVEAVLAPRLRLVDRLTEDGRLPIALRPLLLPGDTAARALVIARAALFDPVARGAAVAAVRSRATPLPGILRDLTRLHALRQALAERIPEIRTVVIDRSRPGGPRFVSVPAETGRRVNAAPVEAAEPSGPSWDNSAVGSSVFVRFLGRRVAFSLGDDGVWEFSAFAPQVVELAGRQTDPERDPSGVSLPWRP